MSRWSSSMTFKFVTDYKRQKCLWDNNDPNYRKSSMRMKSWKAISDSMGIPGFGVPDVKIKIKSLRSTYSQEIRKIKESKKIATSIEHVYIPQMSWFPVMYSFLKTFKRIRYDRVHGYDDGQKESSPIDDGFIDTILESNLSAQSEKIDQYSEVRIEACNSNAEEYEPATETIEYYEDTNADLQTHSEIPEETEKPRKKFMKAKNKKIQPHFHEYARKIKKRSSTEVDSRSNEDIESNRRRCNEFEIFGKHIAAQLSKLSSREAIRVQHKIQGILTESRLSELME